MGNHYTDVILKDSRFNTTKRVDDIMLLEPVTRQLVEAIIADAKAHGVELNRTYTSQAVIDDGVVGCEHERLGRSR